MVVMPLFCGIIVFGGPVTLYVDPSSQVVLVSQDFTVNVSVDYVENLYGYQFKMSFDNSKLNASSLQDGGFLNSPTNTWSYIVNNALGYVSFAVGSLKPAAAKTGSSPPPLAIVHFKAVGVGNSSLHLYGTELADGQSIAIPHITVDGNVQVKWAPPNVLVSPPILNGSPGWINISDTFAVNVTIQLAHDVNYWQAGMSFNPAVLECLSYSEGPFLGTGGATTWQPGTIDNVAGVLTPHGASLGLGVGATGTGTLGIITFRVKSTGSSSLVLQNVLLLDRDYSEIIPATIGNGYFELPSPIPEPPTAFFTYFPISPYVNDIVTFDASASSPNGGVITKYEWDFGDNSQGSGMITINSYSTAGEYNVTLLVTDDENLTGSFSRIAKVIDLPVGLSIDVYTQRGGQGLNQSSDTFAPDELVIITAYVTYNLAPVANEFVKFYALYPNGTVWFSRDGMTDDRGLAFFGRLIPASPVFGKYSVNATTTVGMENAVDFVDFNIDWLVQVKSAVPCDRYGVPKNDFNRGEPLFMAVNITNNRFGSTYVLVWTTAQDCWQMLACYGEETYLVQAGQSFVVMRVGQIGLSNFIGPDATTETGARSAGGLGVPLSPCVSSSFYIHAANPDIAVLGVTTSTSCTYIGHSVVITVTMFNEYYLPQDRNVTLYGNSIKIETLNILALPPYQEMNFTCIWDTYTYSQGDYVIRAEAANCTGEKDLSDNTKVDGTVHLGPRVGLHHDISVTSLNSSKTVVGKGYSTNVSVTVQNQGDYSETSNVTIYVNQIEFTSFQGIVLSSGNSTTLTYTWPVPSWFGYGNCVLKAVTTTVPNETDTDDNTRLDGIIRISVPGDVSGLTEGVPDGLVNMRDIAYMIILFNTRPNSPNWNPNADVDNDGVCNMRDIAIAVLNFNIHV
jgi:hypothetical protein